MWVLCSWQHYFPLQPFKREIVLLQFGVINLNASLMSVCAVITWVPNGNSSYAGIKRIAVPARKNSSHWHYNISHSNPAHYKLYLAWGKARAARNTSSLMQGNIRPCTLQTLSAVKKTRVACITSPLTCGKLILITNSCLARGIAISCAWRNVQGTFVILICNINWQTTNYLLRNQLSSKCLTIDTKHCQSEQP